jgi:glycosyltransferase involved in cell wall biosynthesis
MRIAQIAPLYERVPPKLYGGTERVVSYLTEELVRQGHDVTLFASGDSKTSAKLVPCCKIALRLDPSVKDRLVYHIIMLEEVRQRIDQFDILHFHIDILQAPLVHDIADRTLTTQHGRLDLPDLAPFYFGNSLSSRSQMISANICATPIGSALFIMAFRATCFHSSRMRPAAISRFSDGFRPKKGRTARSRSLREPACR